MSVCKVLVIDDEEGMRRLAMVAVVYPYYVLVELLAPVIEAAGMAGLVVGVLFGMIDWRFAALFYLTAYGLGTALTTVTHILEDLSFHRYGTLRTGEQWSDEGLPNP